MFGKIHALGDADGQNDAVVTLHVWWSGWSEMNAGWSGRPQFTQEWSRAPGLTTGAPAEVP